MYVAYWIKAINDIVMKRTQDNAGPRMAPDYTNLLVAFDAPTRRVWGDKVAETDQRWEKILLR